MNHTPSPKSRKNFAGLFRFSVSGFLVALVLQLVALPAMQHFDNPTRLEAISLTIVMAMAVQAVGHRRRELVLAGVLVLPAIAGRWLFHFWPEHVLPEIYLGSALIFILFVIIQFLRFILRAPRVDSEVLCAGVSTYLMLGLLWSFAYLFLAARAADAFVFNVGRDAAHGMDSFTSLYFSFATLSTVGYGDITPASNMARMLAAAEAITGTLFVAVLISRLVSLYSSQPPAPPTQESPGK